MASDNCCPYCGCEELHITERGYSAKKGLLGIAAVGLIGGLLGFHGNKRLLYICTHCGKQFAEPAHKIAASLLHPQPVVDTLAQERKAHREAQQAQAAASKATGGSKPPQVKQRQVCACGAYNTIYATECFSCGQPLNLVNTPKVAQLPPSVVVCQCGAKNSLTSKNCIACGAWLDYSQLPQEAGQLSHEEQPCPHCGEATPKASRKVLYCSHCGQLLKNSKN